MRNFDSLLTELQEAMFPAVKPEDTFVGRVLALSLAMDDAGGLPPGVEADLTDPLDRRLVRVEEILKRHQIPGRDNYHELLLELTTLAVLYDRVQNAQYCLQAVQFIPEARMRIFSNCGRRGRPRCPRCVQATVVAMPAPCCDLSRPPRPPPPPQLHLQTYIALIFTALFIARVLAAGSGDVSTSAHPCPGGRRCASVLPHHPRPRL